MGDGYCVWVEDFFENESLRLLPSYVFFFSRNVFVGLFLKDIYILVEIVVPFSTGGLRLLQHVCVRNH